MASFIPALSLFILVLFTGYFTLPIVDEQVSSSIFPSLNDDLTTEHAFNVRFVPDDETSVLPDVDKKGLIGEHLGFEVSTSFFNAPEENVDQAIRALDELSSTESMTFTTESSLPDFSFTTAEPMTFTTESSLPDFSFTTVEPTTYTSESSFADKRIHHDFSFTTIEPTESLPQLEIRSFTNESENENESETDKREIQVDFTTSDMLSFTSTASNIAPELYTSQSSTSTSSSTSASTSASTSTSTSTSTEKYTGLLKYTNVNQEEQEPEQSTKLMKTFKKILTTKPTNVQSEEEEEPEQSTRLMKTFKKVLTTKPTNIQSEEEEPEQSTKLMKTFKKVLTTKPTDIQSEEEPEQSTRLTKIFKKILTTKPTNIQSEEEEEPEQSTKLTKTFKKVLTTKPTDIQPEDQSAEDSKEPTAPTALFDQEALKKISYIPNDFMVLDENNTFVVTEFPEKYSTSTMKNKEEQQPLTQGSTLLLFLLAALLLCACVMASTLAFVKNRYNLKRKSRVTEMEAHLDEHYQHYPHPFMFQQHYDKQ